ncbi:hypothetical protein [Rhodococcus aerolatus]
MTELAVNACRSRCAWRPTKAQAGGERLFACRGCGSQWVPSEPWTPADVDGRVPSEVRRARRRHR